MRIVLGNGEWIFIAFMILGLFLLISFAAARAGVTQRSPYLRVDGERCVTSARAAAKETMFLHDVM